MMKYCSRILRVILFAAGIFTLVDFAWFAITASVHQGNILLAMIAAVLVVYAIFMMRLPRWVHIAVVVVGMVPVAFSAFLAVYGSRDVPDGAKVDVVIVLGAGLRGEEPGAHLAARLDTAAAYLHRDPHAMVIVSGGYGTGVTISEAEAMARYLIARGIAPERIRLEDQSTSTYENLRFSLAVMEDYFYNPRGMTVVLVTNRFHIYRATRQARGLDMAFVVPLGAPTPRSSVPANYLREMLAVVHFWLF